MELAQTTIHNLPNFELLTQASYSKSPYQALGGTSAVALLFHKYELDA